MSKLRLRKLFAFFLSLCLMLAFSTNVFAASGDDEKNLVANDDFKKVCDQVFQGNGEVYKANSEDVTNSFLEEYYAAYQSENYDYILEGCYDDGIVQITGYSNHSADVTPRTMMQLQYDRSVIHLITQHGVPYDGKSWYLVVTATGTFGYQESMNEIVHFPEPTIKVSFSDLGALFSGNLEGISITQPVINSSKTAASFSVTTTHTVSCPIPGLEYITGTLGPFTNVSNFTISV